MNSECIFFETKQFKNFTNKKSVKYRSKWDYGLVGWKHILEIPLSFNLKTFVKICVPWLHRMRKKKTSNYSRWRDHISWELRTTVLRNFFSNLSFCYIWRGIYEEGFRCWYVFVFHMELYLYLFADWIFCKSVFVCELDLSQISLFVRRTDPAVFVPWTKDIPPVLVLGPEQSSSCRHH